MASELALGCKLGGRLAIVTWDSHGVMFDMFELISTHKPKNSEAVPSPFDWSNEQCLHKWLENNFSLRIEKSTPFYREASAMDKWEVFATGYGSIMTWQESNASPPLTRFSVNSSCSINSTKPP